MRKRMAWLSALGLLGIAAFAALSLTRGQDQAPPSSSSRDLPGEGKSAPPPVPAVPPQSVRSLPPAPAEPPKRDLSRFSPLQQEIYWSAVRGANWLYQMNDPRGRFVPGHLPALGRIMEGDHYLRQAGAALALARAARFTGDERLAVRAAQALLVLLEETVVERETQVRYTALSAAVVNRLAAAGLLILAVNELPAPREDLLEQSEQLCNFLRRQQQGDGSLCSTDLPHDAVRQTVQPAPDDAGVPPGMALYGLASSCRHRPAAWKLDVLRKAAAYYRPWWRQRKDPAMVPWHTAACSEAYRLTGEKGFADFVFEMNDWLCDLQYDQLDPRHPLWYGGYQGWANGKPVEVEPTIATASYAEGLVEACRVARDTADVKRHTRYTESVASSLQFVTRLQFTTANTRHFADWYRDQLLGAFYASHQDGNPRLDYTQHAVSALVQYLTHVAR